MGVWSQFFLFHSVFDTGAGAMALIHPNRLFGKTTEISGLLSGRLVGGAFQIFSLMSWRARRRLSDRSSYDTAIALCLYHVLDTLCVLRTLFGGEIRLTRAAVRSLVVAVFIHAAFALGFYKFIEQHPQQITYPAHG